VAAAERLVIMRATPAVIIEENFPKADAIGDWMRRARDEAVAVLAEHPGAPAVLVQVILRPEKLPLFEMAGRPALPAPLATALEQRLSRLPDIRPAVGLVCIRLVTPAAPESPLAAAAGYNPRIFPPDEVALDRFVSADLTTQYRELREWARSVALPLLAHRAARTDTQYSGVIALGRALNALPPDAPLRTEAIAYRNPEYWRAVMEMAPGDQLVGAMPVFLHAAAGELDRSATLLSNCLAFSRDGSLAHRLMLDFSARLGPFRRQLAAEIKAGVSLHDQAKYDEAIAVFDQVLAAYPNSAWARYERFFSTVTRDGFDSRSKLKQANRLWKASSPEIYRCNPIYTSQFGATTGRSVGALQDRLTVHRLMNKPPDDFGERMGGLADSAMRLEDYGTAALLYWFALGTDEKFKGISFVADQAVELERDDLLTRYLYCLDKLGVPQWKGEFAGDYSTGLKRIDMALKAHRSR
jgi:tetratricopeptide (TPR) repeat protein